MDVSSALALVWQQADRSSQAQVAREIGVTPATITAWKSGNAPTGKTRQRLLEWAERLESAAADLDAATKALEATGRNVAKLAEIRGYAAAVLSMLRSVTAEQEKVVDSLAPYVEAEGRFLAAQVPESELAQIAESVKRSAAQATPGRKKKGSAG